MGLSFMTTLSEPGSVPLATVIPGAPSASGDWVSGSISGLMSADALGGTLEIEAYEAPKAGRFGELQGRMTVDFEVQSDSETSSGTGTFNFRPPISP